MRLRYKPNAKEELEENPLMILDEKAHKGSWSEVFANNNPIELEIGSGKGDFIVEKAEQNPDINYLALEHSLKALVLAGRKFDPENLPNLRGLLADAEDLEEIFAPGEISKIYLNFSTPWLKRKHHKRRLSHKDFLERYQKITKPGAILELKTDDKEFFLASIRYLEDMGMEILKKDYDLSVEDSGVLTEYERKFRKKGLPIYFLSAQISPKENDR